MNVKPLLLLAAAGGAVFLASTMQKGQAVANLAFQLGKVKISFQGVTPVLDLIVKIGNTSNQTLTVKAVHGQVYVNNVSAGTVQSFTQTQILPTTQIDFPLQIRLGIAGIARQIIDIINGQAAVQADVRLVGTANVDTMVFPLDVNYRII